MTEHDPHYCDRIQAHVRAEAYAEGSKYGRKDFKQEVLKLFSPDLLERDKTLNKLLKAIEEL